MMGNQGVRQAQLVPAGSSTIDQHTVTEQIDLFMPDGVTSVAAAVSGSVTPAALSATAAAEATAQELLRFQPFTPGSAPFRVLTNSVANSDATYNHAAYYGWNVGTTHNNLIAGLPALAMGFESGFTDTGAPIHGSEWYIEACNSDGSNALFRPFYARIDTGSPAANNATIHMDIGTDTKGTWGVYAGLANPVIFSVGPSLVQANKNVLVSGNNFTLSPPTGQAIMAVSSVNPIVEWQIQGAAAWAIQALGVNNFTIYDNAFRGFIVLTFGATVAAALTDIASSVKIEGNVGFYNTVPVAKPSISGAKGSNAALASLIAALVAQGLVTDTTTA